MAFTDHEAREALAMIDTMIEQIPDDIMFMAFCYSCLNIREFQYGKCLVCGDVWKLIENLRT